MPLITMKISHLPKEKKAELTKKMTEVASEITGIPEPAFTMFVEEYPTENIAVGGTLLCDRK
jgi:4-oxalocrotonate tautomerase